MKIKLEINPKYTKPEIHICYHTADDTAKKLCQQISNTFDIRITAYSENDAVLITVSDIVRIYTQNQKVYLTTEKEIYRLHERLYVMEEKLDNTHFLRISNSEIVNLYKIVKLDTSITGTIRMYLKGNQETYVSRRYVTKIKKALDL